MGSVAWPPPPRAKPPAAGRWQRPSLRTVLLVAYFVFITLVLVLAPGRLAASLQRRANRARVAHARVPPLAP